jgi:signal transduction histidine kinase
MSETAIDPGAAASGDDRSRPAILLVDDNDANLLALQALLDDKEVELTTAHSGEDALRQLLQRDFALVLMDVQMPGLDGFQTTELIRARERSRYTPIIFVTAIFVEPEHASRAYQLGALDYMTKPFDETALKSKVRALVNSHRQADVIARQQVALRLKQEEAEREHAARQEAERANQAKDDFLAMLSHELRAPLNAILGWAAVLETDVGLPARAAKAATTIARNARAQSRLVDDLLDVSSLVAERLRLEPRVIDLAQLAQAALASHQPAASARGIRLLLHVGDGRFTTFGDGVRLEQVMTNLLANAIKFSHDQGEVTVALERIGDAFELRVSDQGVGIAPALLPHVFERFRQGDASRTRVYGGLGIGLTLARHLAEMHGGAIVAASDGEGLGSSFTVRLPVRDAEVAANQVTHDSGPHALLPSDAPPLAGRRALIVDDDADARDLLAMIVGDAGADVTTAGSVAEALALLRDGGPFDLLLSDLGMPGEGGLSLIHKVRSLPATSGGRIVAVAVSGYGSADDREEALRSGFQAHVAKPFEPAALVGLLERLRLRPDASPQSCDNIT